MDCIHCLLLICWRVAVVVVFLEFRIKNTKLVSIREGNRGDTFQVTPKNERFLEHFSAPFFGPTKLSSNYNGDFASKRAPKMIKKMGFKIFINRRYRP